MSKHTPGPWDAWIGASKFSITGPGAAATSFFLVADKDLARLIIQIGSESGEAPAVATGNSVERARANARLIAAAPDLLEACVAMIEWDEREKDHSVDFHARMALCDAAFQKARAAIAKAEGR